MAIDTHGGLTDLSPVERRALATGGTEGNTRLTAATAVVLVVLLAVEGVTILFLRPLISVHLFVGLMLIPPVGLKLASTGYRLLRYYTNDPAYREKGPPPMWLRAGAPLVVLTTLGVFVTGVWLLLAGPRSRDTALPIHKASFIAWLGVTGLHVLGHMWDLPGLARSEYGRDRSRRVPGRHGREATVALALVAGVVLALLLLPHFGPWQHD